MTEVAVVGVGDWGKHLLRVFDAEASVRLCCHTGDAANADWLADRYPDVAVTTEYGDVLDSDADAVVVATPIETHVPLVRDALEAGKHVYVEKPLGSDSEAAADVAALARERDLRLFVGYLFVHHPLFERVAALAGDAGVRSLQLEWNYVGGFETPLLTNYACHPVSVTTALFGGYERANGTAPAPATPDAVDVTTCAGPAGDPDVLSCTLTYGDVSCDLHVRRVSPRDASTRIGLRTGTDEWYLWDDTDLRRLDRDGGAFETVATADAEPLAAECRRFLSAVETGTAPATDGAFAVAVHDVLAAIERQCEDG